MTDPSSPATDEPLLEPGALLAGRYRLLRAVTPRTAPAQLWRVTDEVLARPVAVKVLPGDVPTAPFLAAAGRAGTLSHPGLARVYDAAQEERAQPGSGRTAPIAYLISEWVEGRTVAEVLAADGAFAPAEAVRLAREAAEALAAAHAGGVTHGRVHPGNVLIGPDGRVRITDTAVAAALHPSQPVPADPVAADTRDLTAVLYALLTARWPTDSTDQPSGDVPAALRASGGAYSPRQVRAGVPRALDAVVVRGLDPVGQPAAPALTTPAALLRALDDLDLKPVHTPRPGRSPRRAPGRVLRLVPAVLGVAVLLAVGIAGYQAGTHVGALPRKPGALDALVNAVPSAPASGPVNVRVDLKNPPVVVHDFDPQGSDGTEQPGAVTNAYDDDPSTAWTTDGYNTALFGGLKTGVGLLVDLGAPTVLTSVKVGLTTPGADLELRSAAAPGRTADAYTVVARSLNSGQVATLAPATPAAARYWLVWFTKLPAGAGGRYRGGIAEMVFTGRG